MLLFLSFSDACVELVLYRLTVFEGHFLNNDCALSFIAFIYAISSQPYCRISSFFYLNLRRAPAAPPPIRGRRPKFAGALTVLLLISCYKLLPQSEIEA